MCLLGRHDLPYLTCHWEARPAVGSVEARRPRVAGSTFVELTLPRTRQSELQDRIQSWHTQQAPHGLLAAPPFLLVSVARYANPVKGKNRMHLPCKVLQQARFPVFCNASDRVQWTSYRLIGGVMHLGSSPQSGHYRTLLAHPNPASAQASLTTDAVSAPSGSRDTSARAAPSRRPIYSWWLTDDSSPARMSHPTHQHTIDSNCYALCFQRGP